MDTATPTVYALETLLPPELEARLLEMPLVILPFGNIEWHSYHLPLGVDLLKAQALCRAVAARTSGVLAPASYWAAGAVPFPYTIDFELELIERIAQRLYLQLGAMGFRVILGITGHYTLEQLLVLKRAALRAMEQSAVTIFVGGEYEVMSESGFHGDHAAKWETALMQAIHPPLVHLERLSRALPADGILGQDPRTNASPELGQQAFEMIVERMSAVGARLLNQTSKVERAEYVQALTVGVRVLEKMFAERLCQPKAQVPPLATPAYLDYLQAMGRGEYAQAKQAAEKKWLNLNA